MKPMTVRDIGAALGATVHGDPDRLVGPDVVIDSRHVADGALFVAFTGEHADGHDYVSAAAAGGAAAAVAGRVVVDDLPTLVVDDPTVALADLARAIIADTDDLRVVGITGSAGKTSTKDLCAQLLARAGETVAPVGSFNNEIGVPLTATRITPDTRFLISEMGARGLGHIDYLCSIIPVDIAVVLNVGSAHIGEFGSRETIARAKGELPAATGDWAVLNADDPYVALMATRTQPGVRHAWFGVSQPHQPGQIRVWASNLELTSTGHRFDLVIDDGAARQQHVVDLHLAGRHQVANALAAAAVATVCGLDGADIAAGLTAATTRSRWRMEVHERGDDVVVINDAYNANPESMRAALSAARDMLHQRRSQWPDAQLWAVLGDMLELGPRAADAHRELADDAVAHEVSHLVAVGEHAATMANQASGIDGHVAPPGHAAALVRPSPGDIVLVKASRGLELDKVAAELIAEVTP